MRTRFIAVMLLALIASTITPTIAEAQEGGCVSDCPTTTDGDAESDGESIAGHAWETQPGSSSDGGTHTVARLPAWLQQCSWTHFQPGEEVPNDLVDGEFQDGFDEPTWVVTCPTETLIAVGFGDPASGILEIFADGDMSESLINAVINEARSQTPLVSFYPATAPAGNVEVPMITRFPTWLWIPEADWQPVSATASIPPLSVTVTAVPVSAQWSGADDPETITCDPGTAYDFGRDYDSQESDCSVMFLHSSAAADYELSLTVTWEISYVCSAFCGAGTLPNAFTESTREVRVAEIQSLVTSSG